MATLEDIELARQKAEVQARDNPRFLRLLRIVEGMAHNMRSFDDDLMTTGRLSLMQNYRPGSLDPQIILAVKHDLLDRLRYWKTRSAEKRFSEVIFNEDGIQFDRPVEEEGYAKVEMEDLLSILDTKARTAFTLHYLEGWSLIDTADKLDTPVATVKRILARAKKIIRKEMA